MHHIFFAHHYGINMKISKCVDYLQIQFFFNHQKFKSSPKIKFSHSLVFYTLSHNFSSYIMCIITHLYVVKDFWNFENLKHSLIFKILQFHIFKV